MIVKTNNWGEGGKSCFPIVKVYGLDQKSRISFNSGYQ